MWETLYLLANLSVIPFWASMILAPRWSVTQRLIATPLVPALYAALYLVLVCIALPNGEGGMDSLANLRVGFARDATLLLAWVHYLSFDLFVGFWVLRDGQRHGIHHLLVAPCLMLTLMFGPTGLLLYLLLRSRTAGFSFADAP